MNMNETMKGVIAMTENTLFIKSLSEEMEKTYTENGASAYRSAGCGALLDLFAVCGSLRSRPDAVNEKYPYALKEDRLLAAKLAFYTRDARGGLGERESGRRMFRMMAKLDPEAMEKNLALIPEYGRWDDLVSLLGTPLEESAVKLIASQLKEDMENLLAGKSVSLCAKWMPSVNASSRKTRRNAAKLAKLLGMSEKIYRRTLSVLRAALNVTEVRLSEKNLAAVKYPEVTSRAMMIYRDAFARRDAERFGQYLEAVSAGKEKINSSVLFPYDIIEHYLNPLLEGEDVETDPVLEEQWKSLPDYIEDGRNILIMADLSGSMYGRPMAASVSLAVYFAERCTGAFHNCFMIFSNEPELVKIQGKTLLDKTADVLQYDIGLSTNLEAAFEAVLNAAVHHHLKQEDLPESMIVITDGEINHLLSQTEWGFADEMKARFEAAGYQMPNLVLWNVDSRHDTFHARGDDARIQICSGLSASVFRSILDHSGITPYEYMTEVLNDPRYDAVKV